MGLGAYQIRYREMRSSLGADDGHKKPADPGGRVGAMGMSRGGLSQRLCQGDTEELFIKIDPL